MTCWDRCYDFLKHFRRNFGEDFEVFNSKISLYYTLVVEKNANSNRQKITKKSPKITKKIAEN
jgi:hypothetical protein